MSVVKETKPSYQLAVPQRIIAAVPIALLVAFVVASPSIGAPHIISHFGVNYNLASNIANILMAATSIPWGIAGAAGLIIWAAGYAIKTYIKKYGIRFAINW